MIFLCQTPLHFLIASSFGSSVSNNTIIWLKDSEIDEELIQFSIEELSASLVILMGVVGGGGVLSRFSRRMSNIRVIEKLNLLGDTVVFNDTTPEAQILMTLARKNMKKSILAEDGVAIYSVGGFNPYIKSLYYVNRLFFGRWWVAISRIGESKMFDKILATNPNKVRANILPSSGCQQIRRNEAWLESVKNSFQNKYAFPKCIFIAPLSEEISESEIRELNLYLTTIKNDLGIKYHPRESVFYINIDGVAVIDKKMPIEIVALISKDVRLLIGCKTSALHMCRWIDNTIDVKFFETSEMKSQGWVDFYRDIGVESIN